jgi:O-antigen/teichoic acid export membrane protein
MLDMGLSSTLTREISINRKSQEGLNNFRVLLRSVEYIFIAISIIVFFLIYIFRNWIVTNWLVVNVLDTKEVAVCVLIMGAMVGFRWLNSLYKSCIIGLECQVWFNAYNIIFSTFRFVGAFLLVKYVTVRPIHYFEYQLFIMIIENIYIKRKIYSFLPYSKKFIKPSYKAVKKIAPFALSIAYTSILWIPITQIDKLMLSTYLPLGEYGYFAMIMIVSNSISQFSGPVLQAIKPRLTFLYSKGNQQELYLLYRKSTQIVAVISFAVAGSVAVFSQELLFAWTGDRSLSLWGKYILFWYALGNSLLSIQIFQYYLQFAYGELKYHIRGNTVFGVIQLGVMFLAIYNYGALGAGVAWFTLQLLLFIFWAAFIHSKFMPGLHKKWLLEDLAPVLLSTTIVLFLLKNVPFHFGLLSRIQSFILLMFFGMIVLVSNTFVAKQTRRIVLEFLSKGRTC